MPWGNRPRQTLEERFWNFVMPEPNSGCWLWIGYAENGYGRIGVDGKSARAHRVAYELYVGKIPKGLHLDHLCRVPSCVNPEHLEPVTARTNCLRGTAPAAANFRKTHCKRGHPLFGKNLYVSTGNRRVCRICRSQNTRQWRKRRSTS